MLNAIWLLMMVVAVIVGGMEGHLGAVVESVTLSAKLGFEMVLGLVGLLAFWLGIMNIAEESGLIQYFARAVSPLMRWLFPEVPIEHPAMGAMVMNMSANMLGIGNAATPLGLKAMEELQTLNMSTTQASNAMCTFLAINTSSIQLIPATAIAVLASNGATHPTQVIASSLCATLVSTVVAIVAVKSLAKLPLYRLSEDNPL